MTMNVMIPGSPATTIKNRVDQLESQWSGRKNMVKKWYKLIELENNLAQDGMESVIGTDPRSSYNLAKWLLTPKTWAVRSFKDGMSEEEISGATALEQQVQSEVSRTIRASRGHLHGSYLTHSIGMFLATGWISMIAAPTVPHWTINAWHPMTVFPSYTDTGELEEVGRKFTLSPNQANTMIFMEGWIPPRARFTQTVIVRQWWIQTPVGTFMALMMNEHLARPLDRTMFMEFPIYCQPAGGLPDDGTIIDNKWKAEVGQGLVAAVMDLQHNYNKMLTYMQQLLRDTANPKWIERVGQGAGVVTQESLTKRGAIWTIALGDDIWAVQPPGPPVDLRTHAFDMRSQMQRTTFQDASFGGGESAFLMANITAGTKQILQPFIDGVRDANGELFTRTANLARAMGMPIGGTVVQAPENVSLDFRYDVEIPGDFLQRANSARILNPSFRLSNETIQELQFPEIRSPFEEQLRLTTEDTLNTPEMQAVKTIREMRRAAFQANRAGDGETEALITGVADRLEAQITGNTNQQGQPETFRNIIEAGSQTT